VFPLDEISQMLIGFLVLFISYELQILPYQSLYSGKIFSVGFKHLFFIGGGFALVPTVHIFNGKGFTANLQKQKSLIQVILDQAQLLVDVGAILTGFHLLFLGVPVLWIDKESCGEFFALFMKGKSASYRTKSSIVLL
tara:strand:- start:35 stop:448 length:414 start_codon:yes stop_codon:yes gene_type:complete